MRIKWRNLELPSRVAPKRGLTDTYGKFVAEPFERGFGTTVGNSLRRVLLSSLEGSGVTRVKIQGVQHEVGTIPGIVEDVTDIILNIRSLVVKNNSDSPKTIRIDRHQKGVVKAADIQHDADVQVINPEHVVATLTDDVPFVVEMTVENGRGYRSADDNAGKEREINAISLDVSFSPVVRVKYEIKEMRVGHKTKYDRLIMEIWTNGTTTPQMALVEAAKILRKHLNPFVQSIDHGAELQIDDRFESSGGDEDSDDVELERKLNMDLAELQLSLETRKCLESANISTVRGLVSRLEVEPLEIRNFDETMLIEVKRKLRELGVNERTTLALAGRPKYTIDHGQGTVIDTGRGPAHTRPKIDQMTLARDTSAGRQAAQGFTATLEFDSEVSDQVIRSFLDRLRRFAVEAGGNLQVLPQEEGK
ncbi:MAG TPA: DNA-directed RNA polymerase subunit alpha [Gemmataceae bacterium]|jgi:DNA-directed RNA polymerase subunit alpha|nr:DNA-directed RNA polymerase subunit alpha [Gemmataceae bacterium]